MEQWKDIKGFEEYYQVSNLGRVRSKDRVLIHNINKKPYTVKGRILKAHYYDKPYNRYYKVALSVDGVTYSKSVHRLVAEAFLDNPHNKPIVNHIDGNTLNNEVSNLEYVTAKENTQHAIATGLLTYKSGSQSHRAILNEDIVREIKIKLNNGDTQASIVRWLETTYGIKVSRGLIGLISTGARWSQVTIG